jgi:hypothetical protein
MLDILVFHVVSDAMHLLRRIEVCYIHGKISLHQRVLSVETFFRLLWLRPDNSCKRRCIQKSDVVMIRVPDLPLKIEGICMLVRK